MPTDEGSPSAFTVGEDLAKLIRKQEVTLALARSMRETLSLHVVGGPSMPETKDEAVIRVDKLWTLLQDYIEFGLDEELEKTGLVREGKMTAEAGAEAASIIFQLDERRDKPWTCDTALLLPECQEAADTAIRKPKPGNDTYFRKNFQKPILEALARLLLKAEGEYRKTQDQSSPSPSPHGDRDRNEADSGSKGKSKPLALKLTKGVKIVAAIALLTVATLVVGWVIGSDSGRPPILSPHELSVSLRASVVPNQSESVGPSDSIVDLGTDEGPQELGFQAVVRPLGGQDGRIPAGLRLAVVLPRESLTNQALSSALLEFAGSPVREVGQQASDSVEILSRQADSVALDIPSDLRIRVKRDGSTSWEPLHLLSPRRWLTCSKEQCELRVPLARFARRAGDAVRLDFQVLAFGAPREAGPLLLMDMEQRLLQDQLATDGELRVSPGDQVLYSFYVANRGTAPAHNLVVRFALPRCARFQSGSGRATHTGASTPISVDNNVANGGLRYGTVAADGSIHLSVIVEILPKLRDIGEMYPYWFVRSKETQGYEYFDSVVTSAET